MVMNLQSIIDQHTATIRQLQERIDGDAVKYNQKCQHCEKLERELAIEKSKNQVHQEYREAFTRKGPLISLNVSGNVDISKDAPDVNRIKTPVEPSKAIATANPPSPTIETFSDRVKSIIRQAATKNGQIIESNSKGHKGRYAYNIDDLCFCKAIDELSAKDPEYLMEYLGGDPNNVQVTKVCFFIGQTIRMNVISNASLRIADILFAFKDYYPNIRTVQSKLCEKSLAADFGVLFGIFEGLLKRYLPSSA